MLTGYTDGFSVEPGGEIAFMVSSSAGPYEASLVRLIHGDRNPAGPGFKQRELQTAIDGTYDGGMQETRPGSYGRVDGIAIQAASFSFSAWIWPTTSAARDPQCVMAIAGGAGGGAALEIRARRLCLSTGPDEALVLEQGLEDRTWYFVYAGIDVDGSAELEARSVSWPAFDRTASGRSAAAPSPGEYGLFVAARPSREGPSMQDFYNGKVAEPRVYRRTLEQPERRALAKSSSGLEVAGDAQVGAWNLCSDPGGTEFADRTGSSPAGMLVNRPASAMTDHTWDGEQDWRQASDEFRAVHFHADDLDDAGWSPSFSWLVPDDLESGVYAAWLRADGRRTTSPSSCGRGAARRPPRSGC